MDEIIIEKSQEDFEKERVQLIENIIVSEIGYARNKELGNLEYVQEDERIIADWMERYSITKEDIMVKREEVLRREKTGLTTKYDEIISGKLEVVEAPVEDEIVEINKPTEEEIKANIKKERDDAVLRIDSLLANGFSF